MAENRFNLVEQPWIPVANEGLKSLKEVFSGQYKALGGTPREKISILKLLQAIAQAAFTPKDSSEWELAGPNGLKDKCLAYLEKNKDAFFLYGDKPFLQMPVEKAELKSYGCFLPEVATGNTSRLTNLQTEYPTTDAQRALILVCEMAMCLGGKKIDKKCILSTGYEKKSSGYAGPGMCTMGLQHSFLTGKTILETLWLNLLDNKFIEGLTHFTSGLGTPPWEKMPESENCQVAEDLKKSLLGRLVPMARFCLLKENGMHYTEGIRHPDYLAGFWDPSSAINKQKSKAKMLWCDPEKRPWRNLAAMLAFLDSANASSGFDCLYLKNGIERLKVCEGISDIGIWCGGFKVSSNAGEQYASGNDDCVESEFRLNLDDVQTSSWYSNFHREMEQLEKYAKVLYSCVYSFMTAQKMDDALARTASGIFWEKAEGYFPELVEACKNDEAMEKLRAKFRSLARGTYDVICPHNTARQMQEWARCRPFGKIERKTDVKNESGEAVSE